MEACRCARNGLWPCAIACHSQRTGALAPPRGCCGMPGVGRKAVRHRPGDWPTSCRSSKTGLPVGMAGGGQPRGPSRGEPSHHPGSTRGVLALQAGRAKHHPRKTPSAQRATTQRGAAGRARPGQGPEDRAGRGHGKTARRQGPTKASTSKGGTQADRRTAKEPSTQPHREPGGGTHRPQEGRTTDSQSTEPHGEPGAGTHTGRGGPHHSKERGRP